MCVNFSVAKKLLLIKKVMSEELIYIVNGKKVMETSAKTFWEKMKGHVQKSAVTEYYTEHNFTYTGEVISMGHQWSFQLPLLLLLLQANL